MGARCAWVYDLNRYERERNPDLKPSYIAYTREQTKGGCLHYVSAMSGYEAKKLAIRDHKSKCVPVKE